MCHDCFLLLSYFLIPLPEPGNVMVVMYHVREDREADWCRRRGWQLCEPNDIYGCEARCVVLLDCLLYPEFITRAINTLVIVTNNR